MKKETVMKQVEAYVDGNERHLARTRKAASKYWGMAKAAKDRGDRLAEENAHLEKRVAYWEHECSRAAELSYKKQLEARAHLPQADAALLKQVEDLKEKVKFLLRQREEHLAQLASLLRDAKEEQLRGKNLDYKRMYENLKENTVLILREIEHDIKTRPVTQMCIVVDKIQNRINALQGRF